VTYDDILKGIEQVFKENISNALTIDADMDLLKDLQLDSIQLTTLVFELEDYFQITFDEGDELTVKTVADLAGLVQKLIPDVIR